MLCLMWQVYRTCLEGQFQLVPRAVTNTALTFHLMLPMSKAAPHTKYKLWLEKLTKPQLFRAWNDNTSSKWLGKAQYPAIIVTSNSNIIRPTLQGQYRVKNGIYCKKKKRFKKKWLHPVEKKTKNCTVTPDYSGGKINASKSRKAIAQTAQSLP